jgi:prepilin signal peptidase PulO-like enzyme (type II secretory pathway)
MTATAADERCQTMTPTVVACVLAVVGGLVMSTAGVSFARARSAQQPVVVDTDAEAAVLGAVLAQPRCLRRLALLTPDHFACGPHRRLWAALVDRAVEVTDAGLVAEAAAAGAPAITLTVDSEALVADLRAAFAADAEVVELLDAPRGLSMEEALTAGGKVLAAWEDRAELNGSSSIVPAPDGTRDQPLIRVEPAFGLRWRVATGALFAAALGAVGVAASGGQVPVAAVVAAAVLAAGLVVLSLIDLATMYIDYPVVVATLAAAAIPSAFAGGGVEGALVAAGVSVAVIVGMQVVAVVHAMVRRMDRAGLGQGDLVLLPLTVGLPLWFTGDYRVPVYGLLGGMVAAIAFQGARLATGRATRDTPFPFGPWLAVGWPFAWAAVTRLGL